MSTIISSHETVSVTALPIQTGANGRCWRDIKITSRSMDGKSVEEALIVLYADRVVDLLIHLPNGDEE